MSDHTIMIIWVMKIFFVQFFCVFLPPLLNIFCFCYLNGPLVVRGKKPNLAFTSQSNTIISWEISETFVIKVVSCLGLKSGCFCRSAVLPATVTEGSEVTWSLFPVWGCVISSQGHDFLLSKPGCKRNRTHFMWSVVCHWGLSVDSILMKYCK